MKLLAAFASLTALLVVGCGGSGAPPRPDLVFVSTKDRVYAIYAMNADGKRQQRFLGEHLPSSASPSNLLFETEPAFSPDGKRVAFASNRSGRFEIYVATRGEIAPRRLTSHPGGATEPAWSPDGRAIAFIGYQPGFLYVVPAAGGKAHRLVADNANASDPAWSPDGASLAFARRTPGTAVTEIWVVHADGRGLRRVTSLGATASSPTWSPDGKRIAFADNIRGRNDLYVIGADGSGVRRLTDSPAEDIQPAWSPDGALIAFSRDGAIITTTPSGATHALTNPKHNDSNPVWNPAPESSTGSK